MGRAPCCDKVGLKRGPWTPEEDQKLVAFINEHGHGSWRALPKKAGLLRCGKSCRLRWTNYLRPDIKRGEFTAAEEQSIIQLHALLGNRWSAIASHLPKRTDNEIKNYWNTHLKKKLLKMGVDPISHKSKEGNILISNIDQTAHVNTNVSGNGNAINANTNTSNLLHISGNGSSATNHMAQWESARLEAEKRLAEEAQLRAKGMWPMQGLASNACWRLPSTFTSLPSLGGAKPPCSSHATMAGLHALDALNTVDLMHALYNWRMSLQGQAGITWPASLRVPNAGLVLREGQAESSSCSSACSDANTNVSPSTIAHGHMDQASPTSTLYTFDCPTVQQKGCDPAISSANTRRKLSWSNVLETSKLDMPDVPLQSCKLPNAGELQGVFGCNLASHSGSFSCLIQDAMLGMDDMASPLYAQVGIIGKDDSLHDKGTCEKGIVKESSKNPCPTKVEVAVESQDIIVREVNHQDGSFIDKMVLEIDMKHKKFLKSSYVTMDGVDDDADNLEVNGKNLNMCSAREEVMSDEGLAAPSLTTSDCAFWSDEIPDYWSSIMLKEQASSSQVFED